MPEKFNAENLKKEEEKSDQPEKLEEEKKEIILTPEQQSGIDKLYVKFLTGQMDDADAVKIKNALKLSEEIVQEILQKKAEQLMMKRLSLGYIGDAIEVKNRLNLSGEVAPEIAGQKVAYYLSRGFLDEALKIKDAFNLSDTTLNSSKIQEAAKQEMIHLLLIKDLYKAVKVQNTFNLPDSPKIQEAVKQNIISSLFNKPYLKNHLDIVVKVKNTFNLPDSPEIQEAAKQGVIQFLVEGNINGTLKIKENFNLPDEIIASPEIQEAAKQGITMGLSQGDIDKALSIKKNFNLPEEISQEAAKQGIIKCLGQRDIDKAIQIKESFNLSNDIIASPEVQEAAKQGIIERLGEGSIDLAIKIKERFNVPGDAALAESAVQKLIESREYIKAILIHVRFCKIKNIETIYNSAVATEIEVNPQLKASYELLQKLLGEKKLKSILLNHAGFWQNVHDNLLFMERITVLPADKQEKVGRIVLSLINSQTNFQKLNELLGSFDADVYIKKQDGEELPFKNFAEFEREAMMQKYDVNVPENASEEFKTAVKTLIKAPGVDAHFIEQMIEKYDNKLADTGVFIDGKTLSQQELENYQNGGEEDQEEEEYADNEDEREGMSNEEFSTRLINIIEGKDKINERQIIKPFEVEIPFDPLNKLTYTAVGIHSLNSQTPKYAELFEKKEGLRGLLDAIGGTDKKVKEELSVKKSQKTKDDPDKKDRYAADYRKALDNATLLKTGEGKKIEGIKPHNIENALVYFNEERMEQFAELVKNCLQDEEIKNLLLQTFLIFSQKGEKIFDSIDLNAFTDTIERAQAVVGDYKNYEAEVNKLIEEKTNALKEAQGGQGLSKEQKSAARREAQQEMFNGITSEKILAQFQNHELGLASLVIYLGFNNRKRHSESVNIKKALDRALKQKKYEAQNNELKAKGLIADNSDVFLSYLNGQLEVEKDDEEAIRGILKQYGYADMGRKLKVEIAKKSDPRGWVCGDYTNCCMPFTSSKNKEYALREDMSYFLVSIVDESGGEDLVGQSVLVAAKKAGKEAKEDKAEKQFTIENANEIVIDNIEIAHRAVKYRLIISQAYEELKNKFPDKKIVIGTSYNDDGGIVTGNCPLETVDAAPLLGDMEYSDWYHHNANYVYYDPEKKGEAGERYFGLQIDMLNRSHIKRFITDSEEYRAMQEILEKIGKGEDDGDGGLIFPDNYSCVIGNKENYKGYIIAADYIKEEGEDDYIEFEKIHLRDDLPLTEKQKVFTDYLKSRKMKKNDQVDGMLFKPDFLRNNDFVLAAVREYFKDKAEIIKKDDNHVIVKF